MQYGNESSAIMNNVITEDRIVAQGFISARSSSFQLTANKVSRCLNTSYLDNAVSRHALLLNLDLKKKNGRRRGPVPTREPRS
jgi:hypothetical protein